MALGATARRVRLVVRQSARLAATGATDWHGHCLRVAEHCSSDVQPQTISFLDAAAFGVESHRRAWRVRPGRLPSRPPRLTYRPVGGSSRGRLNSPITELLQSPRPCPDIVAADIAPWLRRDAGIRAQVSEGPERHHGDRDDGFHVGAVAALVLHRSRRASSPRSFSTSSPACSASAWAITAC